MVVEGNLSSEQLQFFDSHGYLVLESFARPEEVESMRKRMDELLDKFYFSSSASIFSTKNQLETTNDHFFESAEKISFFWEEKAFDEDGKLKQAKQLSINKVGHALHEKDDVFKKFSSSAKVSSMVRSLGYQRPVVIQSMYIFKVNSGIVLSSNGVSLPYIFVQSPAKSCPILGCSGSPVRQYDDIVIHGVTTVFAIEQIAEKKQKPQGNEVVITIIHPSTGDMENSAFQQPGIGGEVVPHQDNSFLYTEPTTCTGLWLALEDATIVNGCLWAIPGSHKNGLVRRFVRDENGVHFDKPSPCYNQKDFVPLEVKAGSLVVLHGDLIHQSFENQSSKSRHAYSLHVVDTNGCKWAEDNWIRRNVDPEPLFSS